MRRLARARDQVRGQLAGGGDHAREAQRAAELHGLERLCQGGEQVAEDGGWRVGAELGDQRAERGGTRLAQLARRVLVGLGLGLESGSG